jgi:hypothetical protein
MISAFNPANSRKQPICDGNITRIEHFASSSRESLIGFARYAVGGGANRNPLLARWIRRLAPAVDCAGAAK